MPTVELSYQKATKIILHGITPIEGSDPFVGLEGLFKDGWVGVDYSASLDKLLKAYPVTIRDTYNHHLPVPEIPDWFDYSKGFLKDAGSYFGSRLVRRTLVKALADYLVTLPVDNHTVIVAHSLGTVLLKEALQGALEALRTRMTIVNLGSPLALTYIATTTGFYPRVLRQEWHDGGLDPVAGFGKRRFVDKLFPFLANNRFYYPFANHDLKQYILVASKNPSSVLSTYDFSSIF